MKPRACERAGVPTDAPERGVYYVLINGVLKIGRTEQLRTRLVCLSGYGAQVKFVGIETCKWSELGEREKQVKWLLRAHLISGFERFAWNDETRAIVKDRLEVQAEVEVSA